MIKIQKVESTEERLELKKEYMQSLIGPMDGYWENVVIGSSTYYHIVYNSEFAGHFCVDSKKCLVQFYIIDTYLKHAKEIFKYVISSNLVENAAVSTLESSFLSLCLDFQKKVSVSTYLFEDSQKVKIRLDEFEDLDFRYADISEVKLIKDKCGDVPVENYYEDLIANEQLFVLCNKNTLLGIGEFRISKFQPQFGDIGMITVEQYRGKGIGTYIITKLKEHCYNNNVKPICSCNYKNIASNKTLEKAGFISNNRIINIEF